MAVNKYLAQGKVVYGGQTDEADLYIAPTILEDVSIDDTVINKTTEKFYIEHMRVGGGCINNGVIHLGNPDIPFGGVGTSGMGKYHGKQGFETFTRPKCIMKSPTWFDVPLWYAPYKNHVKWIKLLFKL
ncbi:MAG: aldehyde dehydrogenase family protein [Chitinophagaceae bacterium]